MKNIILKDIILSGSFRPKTMEVTLLDYFLALCKTEELINAEAVF